MKIREKYQRERDEEGNNRLRKLSRRRRKLRKTSIGKTKIDGLASLLDGPHRCAVIERRREIY
jgi:hypothetical protein